jgi:mono/diheme cytochrome c family protein
VSLIHRPRRKIVLLVVGASVLVLVGVAAGFVVLLSGAYSTSATTQHFRITHRLLDAGLRYSVRSAARDIAVPRLDDATMKTRGAKCFATHCVQCHGAPGVSRADEGKGMLPIASSLAQSGREWPPQWLYYVVSKGVRMTGMPAWEYRMSEQSIWSTVAFLRELPVLSAAEYQALADRGSGFACEPANLPPQPYSAETAKIVLRQYACHSCHRIEGVIGPESYAGPVLVDWSRRKYIAGEVPNTYENLVRWIREPQAMSPQTLMPDLNVSDDHARQMATYLMSLR